MGTSVDEQGGESFHEMPSGNPLALLVNVTTQDGQPLPVGEFTAKVLASMILRNYRVNPIEVVIETPYEAIMEFESETIVTHIAQLLHRSIPMNGRLVEIKCLMAPRQNLEADSKRQRNGKEKIERIRRRQGKVREGNRS